MLDRVRLVFPYVVAVVLPLAGVLIALVRYGQGDRDEALRIALVAFVGLCVYGLLLR